MPISYANTIEINSIPLRTIFADGWDWYMVKDVSDLLDIPMGWSKGIHLRDLPEEQKRTFNIVECGLVKPRRGGNTALFIRSDAVWRLALKEESLAAEDFRDWLVNELLPVLLRRGAATLPPGVRLNSPLSLIADVSRSYTRQAVAA